MLVTALNPKIGYAKSAEIAIKPFMNFDDEFKPVPTAVPPWARYNNS